MSFTKLFIPVFSATVLCASPVSTVYQQRCANCHGTLGDKHVMNKSNPIKGLPVEDIEKSLHEYADGTRPSISVVKTMKKYFLDTNSPEQVHELAEYINQL